VEQKKKLRDLFMFYDYINNGFITEHSGDTEKDEK